MTQVSTIRIFAPLLGVLAACGAEGSNPRPPSLDSRAHDQWLVPTSELGLVPPQSGTEAGPGLVVDGGAAKQVDLGLVGPCQHPTVSPACAGGFCTIPSGCFRMGSPATEPCRGSGETQHEVRLSHAFAIGEHEVSQAELQALLGYNPSQFKSCGPSCPVEKVNWHEAAAYCNALSAKQGLASCYSCSGAGSTVSCDAAAPYLASGTSIYACPGYRLPTEAEWEYAYRAGSSDATYAGPIALCKGSDFTVNQIGWNKANAGSAPHATGQKPANAWGLFDMAGNVWEWSHDRFSDDLGSLPVVDPWGRASGDQRTVRGGSFGAEPTNHRAAHRHGSDPLYPLEIGFRCARTINP